MSPKHAQANFKISWGSNIHLQIQVSWFLQSRFWSKDWGYHQSDVSQPGMMRVGAQFLSFRQWPWKGWSPVEHRGTFVYPSVHLPIHPFICAPMRPLRPEIYHPRPEICPLRPEIYSHKPEICPLRLEICPLAWNLPSQALDKPSLAFSLPLQIKITHVRPQSSSLRMEKTTNGQMDGIMEGPLCSTGLHPLWGHCPASSLKFTIMQRRATGIADHILPLGDLFVPMQPHLSEILSELEISWPCKTKGKGSDILRYFFHNF